MILKDAQVPILVIDSIFRFHDKQVFRQTEDLVQKIEKPKDKLYSKRELAIEIFIKGSLFGVVEALCQNFG